MEKFVCVGLINGINQLEWYFVDIPTKGDNTSSRLGLGDKLPVITPIKAKANEFFSSSSFAAVNSTIYCFGDRINRNRPQTVALDNKIYVMGGISQVSGSSNSDEKESPPWAEVFDPSSSSSTNKWVPLISPPSPKPTECGGGLFSTALPDHNWFVVGSCDDNFFYTYNVLSDSWKIWNHHMPHQPRDVKPTALGSTLLWFRNGNLYAYDLVGEWRSVVHIDDIEEVLPLNCLVFSDTDSDCTPALVHFESNVFCLLCFECLQTQNPLTLLHCVKVCVTITNDKGKVSLAAAAISSQCYTIIKSTRRIHSAVLVNTGDPSPEVAAA